MRRHTARRRVVELSAGCRRVKTFESFYWADAQSQRAGYLTESKSYFAGYHEDDMQKEIAGFLDCPIERIQFDPAYKDTSMFRGYSIDGEVDEEALEALTGYMREEKGLELALIQTVLRDSITYRIYITEKPLEEMYMDWLNANYSDMEKVESKDRWLSILYRYEPKDNILVYEKGSLNHDKVSVRWDLIWYFFKYYFGVKNSKIEDILEDWLGEAYGLIGIAVDILYPDIAAATCL